MILKKDECLRIIHLERNKRLNTIVGSKIVNAITREHEYLIMKYQKLLRLDEYYSNTSKGIKKFFQFWYRWRKNCLGEKLGFTIGKNVFDEGLVIWHYGCIVVNGMAKVGKNCSLHGNNCIGNDGSSFKAPVIGDNVDIGVGAMILGNVHIADNVKIGAGAVVVKSIEQSGVTVVGVPAHIVGKES